MAFSEAIKSQVRRKAHLACCLCKAMGVEVHHIVPQAENGPDTEDNAAPLCPSCHEIYGANPEKRKFIREARDLWYEICERRYAADPSLLADVERALKSIEAHIQSANYPLLPFTLFYTLRHTTIPEAIEHTFQGMKGYKSLTSNPLQLVGTVRLGGSGLYNPIELTPQHSHCTLDREPLHNLIKRYSGFGEWVIKSPMETTVEIYIPPAEYGVSKPSLKLEKGPPVSGPRDVQHVELYDDEIFQDVLVREWRLVNRSKKVWGVADLRHAQIRLKLAFVSFDTINFDRPPRFHNLHLYFGTETPHILSFRANQLDRPVVREDPNPLMRGDFLKVLLLEYDLIVDEDIYDHQLIQIV